MGRHHLPIPFALTALAALARVASGAEADKGSIPDVVIQAEDRRPVVREKPALELPLKVDQPLEADVIGDDGVRDRVPADLNRTTAFAPGIAESPLSAAAPTNWIVAPWRGEEVRVLYPKKELESAGVATKKGGTWELVLADSLGKAFRKYSGEGPAPERLAFDGKADDGSWLAVGQAYTAVYTYRESEKARARTAMGRPFALAGLSLDAPRAVRLAPRALFSSSGSELTDEGKAILQEAAQHVRRHYPGLGLELTLNLGRNDPAWVKAAGEACVKELSTALMLPKDAIGLKTASGAADLKEAVELAVVAR